MCKWTNISKCTFGSLAPWSNSPVVSMRHAPAVYHFCEKKNIQFSNECVSPIKQFILIGDAEPDEIKICY